MATVRAYSVCQSDRVNGAAVRSQTVYSYSPSATLQNGDVLNFGGADDSDPENSMRTGLSQAYCHGGVATSGEDRTDNGSFLAAAATYANNGGLTPTLISAAIGATAATFADGTGPATGVTMSNDAAGRGTGNAALANQERVICSTTNIGDPDANSLETGSGLIVSLDTDADGLPIAANVAVVVAGNGYDEGTDDTVAIDGFPGATLTVQAGA